MKEYKFDLTETPLRLHRLYAYASSDEELRVASAKKLIHRFEERFLGLAHFDRFERRYVMKYKRLKGFEGDFWWGNATLRFSVCSPEIPFFGEEASRLCDWTPIIYSSCSKGRPTTPLRYFLNGKEYSDWNVPPDVADKFSKLTELNSGFIPKRLTIDQFF